MAESSMTKFNRRNVQIDNIQYLLPEVNTKDEGSDKPTKIQGTCGERPIKYSYSISQQVHRIFSRIIHI